MIFILSTLIGLTVPQCPMIFQAIALSRSWAHYDKFRWEHHRDPNTDEIIDLELRRIRFQKELLRRYLEFKKRLTGTPTLGSP